jgi:poly(beta-D-mannuronate) lyase
MSAGPALLLAALLLAGGAAAPTPFAAPGPAAALSARPCPAPPAPVHDLEGQAFYADPAFSIPDPARLTADQAASRPLRDWLRALQRPAERWVALRDPAEAACALALLDAWAQAGALRGRFNRQGAYHRKWTLAGAAIAFLALRGAPDPAGAAPRIAAWLGALGAEVAPPYERPVTTPGLTERRNNHVAWAGLAVGAAGVAAGDRALLRRGRALGAAFLAGVTAEGAHPQELARGRMALHYHLFALQAAAALARLLDAAGEPFAPEERAALDRLARFTFAATRDPQRIAALAGAPQGHLTEDRPWLRDGHGFEVLGGDAAIRTAILPFRPYRADWLGGNVTLLWGR